MEVQGKRDLSVIDVEKTLDRLEHLEKRFALQDDLENDYYMRLDEAEQLLQRIKHTLDCYDERKGAVPLREFLQALLKEQIK